METEKCGNGNYNVLLWTPHFSILIHNEYNGKEKHVIEEEMDIFSKLYSIPFFGKLWEKIKRNDKIEHQLVERFYSSNNPKLIIKNIETKIFSKFCKTNKIGLGL